ncbi:Alpha/beta hydrolase family protein [Babesia bovis T2Bo]|uniref:Lysophospholipase, putative n=1 Tax=Babesia bovis TaxID=5865 RepID=A7AS90_BABBO|nr:Alpha/beta hydrolase family protein [Babesia bovis T2Bo]EDO07409.1 Alpha/beta hydrolase family protein [Babesia bovis T2Bo]|eukprot:XP_001610977.1 lysophospholipase [Babesia bovis T2Bo]
METKAATVIFAMSHFKNKQNLMIRTYSAVLPQAKGNIVLAHGNCGHFRSEFAAYDIEWYMAHYGIGTPNVKNVVDAELSGVYPKDANMSYNYSNSAFPHFSQLDGRNMFDITPRFIYEGSFIQKLNSIGYNVYGLDHQSHGLSQGITDQRNYFLSIDDLADDIIQFIDIVRRGKFKDTEQSMNDYNPHQPSEVGKVFLGGISMGGNIVLRAAQKSGSYNKSNSMFLDGLIAFAPMTDMTTYTATPKAKLLFCAARVIAALKPRSISNLGCTVPDNVNRFFRCQDPIYYSACQSYRVLLNLFDATTTLSKNYGSYPPEMPTLLFHSKDDDVCTIRGTYEILSTHLKNHKDIKFVEMEGSIHCLTAAIYVENIMPFVAKWLNRINP